MKFYTADGAPISVAQQRIVLRQLATELLKEAKEPSATAKALMKERRKATALREKLSRQKKKTTWLERQARAAASAVAQSVYVIGVQGGAVKIGIAKNPTTRMSEIQTGCPERLTLFNHFPAPEGHARAIEKECHRRLADCRKTGEWFDVDWRDAAATVRAVLNEKIEEIGCDLESRWD